MQARAVAGRVAAIVALALTFTALTQDYVQADDQAPLMQLLREGSSFRVRARAALALGRLGDERALGALEAALRDPHAAVRAAAARALGQVGTRRSVPPLRAAAADATAMVADQAKSALRMIAAREFGHRTPEPMPAPQESAPSLAGARYAVVLGEMRNRTAIAGLDLVALLGERIAEELRSLDRVAVFSPAQVTDSVARELRRRKLPSFRIEGTLQCVDGGVIAGEHTMRCQVSLLLMDEPGRTLRSLMRGAASGNEQARGAREQQLRQLAHKTLRGAVQSAMATALQAIEAASIRRDLGLDAVQAEASLAR